MDPRLVGILDRFPRAVDVGFYCAGEAAYDRALNILRDGLYRFEVARRRISAKPASMTSTPEARELPCYLELLLGVKARAGGLFAVAERRIEYLYLSHKGIGFYHLKGKSSRGERDFH